MQLLITGCPPLQDQHSRRLHTFGYFANAVAQAVSLFVGGPAASDGGTNNQDQANGGAVSSANVQGDDTAAASPAPAATQDPQSTSTAQAQAFAAAGSNTQVGAVDVLRQPLASISFCQLAGAIID